MHTYYFSTGILGAPEAKLVFSELLYEMGANDKPCLLKSKAINQKCI